MSRDEILQFLGYGTAIRGNYEQEFIDMVIVT